MLTSIRRLLTIAVSAFILLPAFLPAQQKPQPFDLIQWNDGKFVYGVDYYPEVWDESRWEKDATMMQAAGINFVRLGEFAWAKMEPAEGQFDFAWLDRALKVLNAHRIKAVLGTPTASPPAWLYAKYPDIAAMDENGVRYRFGSRRNYCLHSANYLAATRRIVTAMAEHYKNHPGVLGWQIDNELGNPDCYDPACRAAFQDWCRRKYKTLDTLNKSWGAIFWGHTISSWAQIPLPWNTLFKTHNPSLALDYHRFFSDSTYDYLKLQVDILRKICPRQAITHNEMGLFDNIDYSRLNTALDFVAWDNYPMFGNQNYSEYTGPGLAHDLMRGSKNNQNFMIMEEEGGLPGWSTFWGRQAAPGLYRVWSYQAVAHGADGVCYFRWRTSRYGTEQYWQGVLDQDSYPNSRYKIVAQAGKELAQLTGLLQGSTVVSQVALLVSPDSRWAFHIQPTVEGFDYNHQLHLYYDALRRSGVNVDVVFPQDDFSKYKLLIAPTLFVVDKPLVEKLTQYVKDGGALILTFRSGVKDEHNIVTDQTLPGPLAELAGIAIHEYDPYTKQEQQVLLPDGSAVPARTWFDILDPTTAETAATYAKGYYAGKAAVTRNRFGNGDVFYVGTELAPEYYDVGIKQVIGHLGIDAGPSLPEGVEFATREKNGKKLVFLLNYTDKAQTVSLGQAYQNALTKENEPADVQIPAFEVKVLTTP